MSAEILLLVVLAVVIVVMTGPPSVMSDLRWYELSFGRDLDPKYVEAFLRALASERRSVPVALEMWGHRGSVSIRVGANRIYVKRVLTILRQFVPSIVVEAVERPPVSDGEAWRLVFGSQRRPLRVEQPEVVSRAVLGAVVSASGSSTVVMQWVLGRRVSAMPVPNRLTYLPSESWSIQAIQALLPSTSPVDGEQRRALRAKKSEPAFRLVGRIAVLGATGSRARWQADRILSGIRVAEAPGSSIGARRETLHRVERCQPPAGSAAVANVRELVGLLGWPLGAAGYPGIDRIHRTPLPIPPGVPSSGRVIGASTYPGVHRRLAQSPADALLHTHVIGPTGVGKSTLLLNLITADMRAGRGVLVIDPKGDLAADVLERVPEDRVDDVVVIDPTDAERPVGLNPLALHGRSPELVADQVLAVFHGLYRDNWGPRTQDILHSCLLTLAGRQRVSLCSIPLLLTNAGYRRRIVGMLDDPLVLGSFWAWYESISDGERAAAIGPVMNKLRAFLLRPRIRLIIGQAQPRFDVATLFTKRRIVVARLPKGVIGPEASALLGTLLIAQVWQAVQSRAGIDPSRRHPVMGYIDEFQDYLHLPTDLTDVLAQARGLGFGLTLAHQYLDQLSPPVRSAVLSNARSKMCFQLAQIDAAVFARSTDLLVDEDFMALDQYELYAGLVADGRVTPFASARTLPPPPVTSDPELVRRRSRKQFGRDRAAVEAEMAAMVGPDDDGELGRRPRRLS